MCRVAHHFRPLSSELVGAAACWKPWWWSFDHFLSHVSLGAFWRWSHLERLGLSKAVVRRISGPAAELLRLFEILGMTSTAAKRIGIEWRGTFGLVCVCHQLLLCFHLKCCQDALKHSLTASVALRHRPCRCSRWSSCLACGCLPCGFV